MNITSSPSGRDSAPKLSEAGKRDRLSLQIRRRKRQCPARWYAIAAAGVAMLMVGYTAKASSLALDEQFRPAFFSNPSPATRVTLLPDGRFVRYRSHDTLVDQPTGAITRYLTDGSLDTSFNFSREYKWVGAVVPAADGKLIVVAHRPLYGRGGEEVIRVNADGSVDPTFSSVLVDRTNYGYTSVLLIQPDGKIVVGGLFSQSRGAPRDTIMRLLPDGGVDPSFASVSVLQGSQGTTAGAVYAAALQADGKIAMAGAFSRVDGASYPTGVARLNADGTLDTTFQPSGFTRRGNILAMVVQSDGKLIIGGRFEVPASFASNPTGAIYRNVPLLRLNENGSADQSYGYFGDPNGGFTIRDAKLQSDGKVVAIDYVQKRTVFRFETNGALDASFQQPRFVINPPAAAFSAAPFSLALQNDGRLLVAGNFTDVDDESGAANRSRYGLARLHPDGTLDPSLTTAHETGFDDFPTSFARLADGSTLAGFDTTGFTGDATVPHNLARLLADGAVDAAFDPFAAPEPESAFRADSIGTVFSRLADGSFLVAGTNGPRGSNTYGKITPAGVEDTAFAPDPAIGAIGTVVAERDGRALIAPPATPGNLTPATQAILDNRQLQRLDRTGAADSSFRLDPAIREDKIKWDYDGYLQSVAVDARVLTTFSDGRILYLYLTKDSTWRLVRLHQHGGIDPSFEAASMPAKVETTYTSGVVDREQPYHFTQSPPVTYSPVAAITDAQEVGGGKLVLTGAFDSFKGVAARGIVRLNQDGSLDSTFQSGGGAQWVSIAESAEARPAVEQIELQNDGKLLLAGTFEAFDGVHAPGIASLNADGSVETSFVAPAGRERHSGSSAVLERQPDGSFLLSGPYVFPGESLAPSFLRIDSVGGAPIVGSPTIATAVAGQAFSYQIVASGQPTSYSATGLPPGFSFDPSTGVLSGNASDAAAGTYTISITATNADGTSSTHQLSLTVSQPPPSITSARTAARAVGDSFIYQITATNQPTSYRAEGVPPGLTFDRTTGQIAGTPTTLGVFEIALRAFNAAGSGTATLRLTVEGPPNDDFVNARAIGGSAGTVHGANVGATKQAGEPRHARNDGGKSVWYLWTAPASGGFIFDTNGSSFDSTLAVYTGSSVDALTEIASENYGGSGPGAARVVFRAAAGTVYRIAVDGYNRGYSPAEEGTVILNWQRGHANDEFADAQRISGATGTVSGRNVDATRQPGEPDHDPDYGIGYGRRSVWFAWTAPATRFFTFTADASFYVDLAAYEGNSVNDLTNVGRVLYTSSSYKSEVTFTAIAGRTYTFAIDAFSGGNFTLQWQPGAAAYSFRTLAGARPGSRDGSGTTARFSGPQGAAADSAGNVFVADTRNHVIRKISPDGLVTTVAGRAGVSGGADGSGTVARFTSPAGTTVDADGNVYVADGNHTIRKITPAGVVSTLAGAFFKHGIANDIGGAARFRSPNGVAVDRSGNVYVTEKDSHTVRKVTPDGAVSLVAGDANVVGTSDGPGSAAGFYGPSAVAVDSDGNVYVADTNNHTIRKITPAGVVSTLAGLAGKGGYVDGVGSTARFASPSGVAVGPGGDVYVTEAGYMWAPLSGHTIRRIAAGGVVTTVAGSPANPGSADGVGSEARFRKPAHLTVDAAGSIYVADSGNHTLRRINPDGVVSTFAGYASSGSNDGPPDEGQFNGLHGITVDGDRNVYVADTNNNSVRKTTPDGTTTTLAGGTFGSADGTGAAAQFMHPTDAAVDSAGNVYVTEYSAHTIRKVTPSGEVTTFAGRAGISGADDGPGHLARFRHPQSIAVDAAGNVFVADSGNQTIRKISPLGEVTTFAGWPGFFGDADGIGTNARFSGPTGLAIHPSGTVYVTDNGYRRLRKITPAGVVTTVAGVTAAFAVAVDLEENLYFANNYFSIRKVTPAGVETYIAGDLNTPGHIDGIGSMARFDGTLDLTIDRAGAVYVSDHNNNAIRVGVAAASPVITSPLSASAKIGQPFSYAISASENPASFNASALPQGLTIDTATGSITGRPAVSGRFEITISATNRDGTGSATLAILVSELYADDGIDDAWQEHYFGQNNPAALPHSDPDGDGDSNLFEFTAGLNPTDPASHFVVMIAENGAGTAGTMEVVFGPVIAGRSYTVTSTTDLTAAEWAPLAAFTQHDDGSTRTVTDLAASGARKLYRVAITKEN